MFTKDIEIFKKLFIARHICLQKQSSRNALDMNDDSTYVVSEHRKEKKEFTFPKEFFLF